MAPVVESRTHPPPARGVRRERLDLLLRRIPDHRLTLLVAPAGSGKTTALAQFVAASPDPVAWYCADPLDGRDEVFLAYLQAAIARVGEGVPADPWTTADDVVHALDRLGPARLVIVIDDLHTIAGRPAELLLGRIVAQAPPHVSLAFGSRTAPRFDTSRWQVAGDAQLVSADDLRFRTWEAEDLLERAYALPLRPEEVARLTRRVEGWAAGFQLFHLAVRDKPPLEQRRLIDTASSRSALARQYLTQNVLAGLPADLRDFLVQTSLLGVLTGELADEFLERRGSIDELRRLEELELFVTRIDDRTYRYHEVLRSHLEAELMSVVTASELEDRFTVAAALLDRAGHSGEAVRCYARAGRWADVSRLAGQACSEPFATSRAWLDLLGEPQAGLDPWVSLAQARAELANGRFTRASEHYVRAEELFGDAEPGAVCRRERIEMESFLDPLAPAPNGWLGDLHAGLRHDPLGAANRLARRGSPEASVASGVLLLVVGQLDTAAKRFDDALLHAEQPDWAIQAGRLGRQLARLLLGDGELPANVSMINHLVGDLESAWLTRFARAVVAAVSGRAGAEEAARIARDCVESGDPWGAAFAHLCAGVAAFDERDTAHRHFGDALSIASRHHTVILEAAAHGGLAAVTSDEVAAGHAEAEQRLVRRMGAPTRPIDRLLGLHTASAPPAPLAAPSDATAGEPRITVRCLGDFSIGEPGRRVDLRTLRPRARTVLQRLALDIGRGVHRDQLLEDLWSDADEASAVRSLQVAVSAIRRLLDDAGAPLTVERVDERYVLTEPSEGACDLAELRRLQRRIDGGTDPPTDVVDIGRRALACYAGELMPAAGASDWVVGEREHVRIGAARIARSAAGAALETGDAEVAVVLAERGLEIDPFDDTLWRLAIDAHERRGDACAAERLRRGYAAMLADLGVEVDPATS